METGVFMATQNFKRNLFKYSYREGGKNQTLVCFLLLLKREIKNVSLFLPFGDTWPAFLTLSFPPFLLGELLPRERGVILIL